jgi:threonine/homoserine/homoserine lactone efflux protein
MSNELLIGLVGFALVSAFSPGPNNLMLLSSGMNFGWRKSVPHILGIAIGFPVMIFGVGMGITQIFEAYPVSLVVMKVLSAVYLIYLAYKIASTRPAGVDMEVKNTRPLTFVQAAAFQWVNPKAWAMALTAISAYTIASNMLLSVFIVIFVFLVVGMMSANTWTIIGLKLRMFLSNPTAFRAFNIGCALILVATLYPVLTGAFA